MKDGQVPPSAAWRTNSNPPHRSSSGLQMSPSLSAKSRRETYIRKHSPIWMVGLDLFAART